MKKENLFHSFEVLVREYANFPMPVHRHTFFELCYVMSGSGIFRSDSYTAAFQPGALLLVSPEVNHVYDLAEQTRLIFIRFSEYYLKPYFTQSEIGLLYAASEIRLSGWSERDKEQLVMTAGCIVAENCSSSPDERLYRWWANCIIRISIRRILADMAGKDAMPEQQGGKAMLMMQYIRLHLYQSELLRLKNLGEQFNLSEKYVGKYFKVHSGESLQSYIARCRLLEVEKLLTKTDMSVSEIALRLGFTDESHLNHAFKKSKGITPRDFRKGRKIV